MKKLIKKFKESNKRFSITSMESINSKDVTGLIFLTKKWNNMVIELSTYINDIFTKETFYNEKDAMKFYKKNLAKYNIKLTITF